MDSRFDRHRTYSVLTLLCIFLLGLTSCTIPGLTPASTPSRSHLAGRLLLWHDWEGESVQTLNLLIAHFKELNPDVTVITIAIPTDELVTSFVDAGEDGLGPDLVLTDAGNIVQLVDARLLRELRGRGDVDLDRYLSGPLSTVARNESVYGVPFSAHTQVLFYNRSTVTEPIRTLDGLLEQLENGATLGLSTRLVEVIWGIGAFGGRLLDEEGNLTLVEGGFLNWIDFLSSLASVPGMALNRSYAALRARFAAGQLDYLVGSSLDIPYLRRALAELEAGPQELGVAELPKGANGWQPRPILYVDAFGFSRAASEDDTDLALAFADFMTNPQQQGRLLTESTGRLPVINRLQFQYNLPETVNELVRQSRSARPVPMEQASLLRSLADITSTMSSVYRQAMAGTISARDAVDQITQLLAARYGWTVRDIREEQFCVNGEGTTETRAVDLVVWHALSGPEVAVLAQIGDRYGQVCPGVQLRFEQVDWTKIGSAYRAAVEEGEGPDILIESTRVAAQLAEDGLIRDLSDRVGPEFLQQFIPEAEKALRYHGRLYGLPESVLVLAEYRNVDLAPEPLFEIDEIPIRVSVDWPFALPANFFYGYWGMGPFGGFDFDPVTGELLNIDGLRDWLAWLQAQQGQPGIVLEGNWEDAEDRFAAGEAAFLVSGPWSLGRLRRALGDDRLRVSPLPAGKLGQSSPILQVRGVMVNSNISDAKTAHALAFGRYLTSSPGQSLLLETGEHVPALVNIDLSAYPLLPGFREQAKVAAVVVENSNFAVIERNGDLLYREVLFEGIALDRAMDAFVERVLTADDVAATEER